MGSATPTPNRIRLLTSQGRRESRKKARYAVARIFDFLIELDVNFVLDRRPELFTEADHQQAKRTLGIAN